MKIRQLLNILESKNPDDDVCVMLWFKEALDYPEDDEVVLTKEAWTKICTEFEEADSFYELGEWIADAVLEYATPKQENKNDVH